MDFYEGKSVFLSQVIAGFLLYKREITNQELLKIFDLTYQTDAFEIDDSQSMYDIVYDYLDFYDDGMCIKDNLSYSDTIIVNNKKVTLSKFLLFNTNECILKFLGDKVFNNINKFENYTGVKKKKTLKKEAI